MTRNILSIFALSLLCLHVLAESGASLLTPIDNPPKITDTHQRDDAVYEKYAQELRDAMGTAYDDDEVAGTPNQDDQITSNNDQNEITEAPVTQPETPTADSTSEEKPTESSEGQNFEQTSSVAENSSGLGGLILGVCMLCCVIVLAFACHYRYQLEKYKIPPFTPPSFCPNFLFPRSYSERNGTRNDNFQMVEVSDYNPPELGQA